jgi:hypothetical protein
MNMARILIAGLLITLLVGCVGPVVPAGRITGSGNLVSRSYALAGFSQIVADNTAQVQVTRGDAYSVNVEVDDNLESRLEVSVTGETLHIGLTDGIYSKVSLRAQVTMPALTGVTLNGASTLNGELAGEEMVLHLNGASVLTLTGTAGRVTIQANAASQALLGGLAAGDVEVDANGASQIQIKTGGAVTGKANGASIITVTGSPTSVSVQTEGASQVITK